MRLLGKLAGNGSLSSSKKKKKKKSKKGDDPGGSSDDVGQEEESSSSESDMKAPLEKKSSKKPGAVLNMLVKHAKETLDQTAVVDTEGGKDLASGVKMKTYFNLMVRPYHGAGSRDMKEMNHLAACLDELRSGLLGQLGDSLASRFLAIHTAVNEGNCQFLELHPLEPTQGAPTSLLLEAKKHGKIVNKSLGYDEWKGSRYESGQWQGGGKQGGGKSKGKGKGKEGGKKGREEGSWGSGGGWYKQKKNWWGDQKEKPDGKDTKPAAKDDKKP